MYEERVTIDDIPIFAYGVWLGIDAAVKDMLSELGERSYRRRRDLELEKEFVVYFCLHLRGEEDAVGGSEARRPEVPPPRGRNGQIQPAGLHKQRLRAV
jgi:hypothetical protein